MTTYQAHARRRERVAIKAAMREVPPEEFGECRLCGFTHSYPLERAVCEVCGGLVCRGEPACGCGDSVGGGEYNVTHQTSAPATRSTSGSVASQRR